jgi:hypothetical protein
MRYHRNKFVCELCGAEGEVWRLYSAESKRWFWVCKRCWDKNKDEFLTIDDIVETAKIL